MSSGEALGAIRSVRTGVRWWAPLVILAIAWLTWEPLNVVPISGLDPSWQAGLSMATDQGLVYGREVVFTYGPLGFLGDGAVLWSQHIALVAYAYSILLHLVTVAALFFGARQTFGVAVSFALAVVVASLTSLPNETAVLMILAAWALRVQLAGRPAILLAAAVGTGSAIQLLDKISVGVAFTLMAAVLVVSLPGRRLRPLLAAAVAGVVAFLVCWIAANQPLAAIPDYVRGALQISTGYGPAMSIDEPSLDWAYAVLLTILAAGIWAAWETTEGTAPRQRIGLVVIWILFWFFGFKEGMVREDISHLPLVFDPLVIAWFGFHFTHDARTRSLAGIGALVALMLAVESGSLTQHFNPDRALTHGVSDFETLTSASKRQHAIAKARSQIIATEQLDPAAIRLVRGSTVAVFPDEVAVVWAYGLKWRPLPVMQSYAAYTPYLDRLDANFLASSRAPQRILMSPSSTIDNRLLAYDEPETTRALLCRYRPIQHDPLWAVLAPGPNRCSGERLIATDRVAWGEPVPVPPLPTSHSLISVKISGVQVGGLESIRSLLWKPAQRSVILNNVRLRLVEANAGDGLPVRVGSGLDYPSPFALVPTNLATIGVTKVGERRGGRPITYRFYAQTYTTS